MFKNILAATDLVNIQDAPVLSAARIAEQHQSKLLILHVLESISAQHRNLIKDFRTGEEITVTSEYEDIVRKELDAIYSEIFQSHSYYEIRITTGLPWEEIVRCSSEINADLVVLGPHSAGAEENLRVAGKVGGNVNGVVARERCPVMIVNPLVANKKMMFNNIMICIDFSVSCECALCFAVKLAQRYNSKLLAFHMLPVPPLPKYSRADYEADLVFSKTKLEVFCHGFLDGTDYEYHICGGALPHLEILNSADEKDVDLIVMGSHTKVKTGKWYAGSAVERVSFRSRCPVVVVTDPDALLPWEGGLDDKAGEEQKGSRLIRVFSDK